MILYVLDTFDNGEFIYFKVDVKTDPLPEGRSFYGRDFKFKFLKGNELLFLNRINRIKQQVYNGYFWGFKNMYFNGTPYESILEGDDIIKTYLVDRGAINAIYESIIPDKYFSHDCKNKYQVIKKMNEEYSSLYLLKKEVMATF